MTVTEIKKELYKNKPQAFIRFIRKGIVYYYSDLDQMRVNFEIPVSDMGDATFSPTMEGKHLIRWLVQPED